MPKYPVFYDQSKQVLSLPPIINSDPTKISMDTKDIFIEVTGTDLKKCQIVLSILACHFSEHCQGDQQFCMEPVEVTYEDGKTPTQKQPTL
jgi:phenylalanyl-tRNA synthetase beta chain